MSYKSEITKLDLYGILEVEEDATKKEIVKAYRKKALKCHPDKNPDNPRAAELFQQLSEAFELLTDAAARAAYDKILKAKRAAERRHRELDSKRKKFKEDLEAREQAAQTNKETDFRAQLNLEAEIARLRKEGSALLKAEQELLNEQIRAQKSAAEDSPSSDQATPKLKVKWKAKKVDSSNGGYSKENLTIIFSKYGEVLNVLVSSKRNGSAIVELANSHAALLAVQNEIGLSQNPLSITWLEGQPQGSQSMHPSGFGDVFSNSNPGVPSASSQKTDPPPVSSQDRDFESIVLTKLRQAEERKRLIEQMEKEEENT